MDLHVPISTESGDSHETTRFLLEVGVRETEGSRGRQEALRLGRRGGKVSKEFLLWECMVWRLFLSLHSY